MLRLGSILVLALIVSTGCSQPSETPVEPPPPASVLGRLSISAHGPMDANERPALPARQVTTWVNDPNYQGMADLDLRGFLDGRFLYGWNQPGQIHVRIGRRGVRALWGETELMRNIQRWADVVLPPDAEVVEARLEIRVEDHPDRPLDVFLYALHKDFDPGQGGERHDNTSPPVAGEAWWGARAHERERWGHPGVGFASETHADADTPTTALAEYHFTPGDDAVVFSSGALATYAQARATRGLPLLFLVKLSDELEDTPGTILVLYSGEQDARTNPARRPALTLTWETPDAVARVRRELHLEHGRTVTLPRLEIPEASLVAVSFESVPGYEPPELEVRGGSRSKASPWLSAARPLTVDWTWLEVRVQAAQHPVTLGSSFETRLRDTWVRTAPPETQTVVWRFTSPSGREYEVPAHYEGDYTWRVSFEPDLLGRWRYRWGDHFVREPYLSAEGIFDVVPGDLANVERQLRELLQRAQAQGPPPEGVEFTSLSPAFWRLERAVYQLTTPGDMASPQGQALRGLLTEIRAALSGQPVPDEATPTPMKRRF